MPRHTPDTPREAGPRRSHRRGRESGAVPGAQAAGPSPRLPTAALGPILGERRGLPEPGPSRGRELLLQPLVLPLQPIVRTLQPIILTSQLIVLTLHLITRRWIRLPTPPRQTCHGRCRTDFGSAPPRSSAAPTLACV